MQCRWTWEKRIGFPRLSAKTDINIDARKIPVS